MIRVTAKTPNLRLPRWASFSGLAKSTRIPIIVITLVFTPLVGCGGEDSGVQLVEPVSVDPGTLVTLSVTPIEPPEPGNLIQNGDFLAWQPGTSAPNYFMAPNDNTAYSSLEPANGPEGEEGAVKQTWRESDALDAYTRVFRTWVTGLRPNAQHRLTVRVNNTSPNELLVRAFQYNARSPAEAQIMEDRPEILGGVPVGHTDGFQEFSFMFTTRETPEFCVLIAAKNNAPEGTFPAFCVWDEWRLVEAPARGPEAS